MLVLETERLQLRHLTLEDAPFVLELLNDPAFVQYIGDRGVRNLDDARRNIENGAMASYARNGHGLYLAVRKDGEVPVGLVGLVKRDQLEDPDVGYALLPAYRSQGYAYEAASAVLDYGRSVLGMKRIVAICSPENYRSIKLLEKLGLSFERMLEYTAGDVVMVFA